MEAALAWREFMVSEYYDAGQERWLADNGIALLRGTGRLAGPGAVEVDTSELNRAWLACWQEQLAEGMELAREVLERQGTFARTSLERLNAQASRSAELASGMVDGYIAPLRESAGKAAEQTTRPAA